MILKTNHRLLTASMMLLVCLSVSAQRFFNLTAGEVRIDSVLPHFTYSVPLGENYADSVYEVSIKYPEFIDMSQKDILAYQRITGNTLPELPEIEQQIVVERKNGSLELSFVPLVQRGGKHQILVSFMLEVRSKAAKRSVRKLNARMAGSQSERYASHSVLASGKWAKIRIPSTGIYQLTESLIRQAGFSDLSKVKVYGYGGNLQNERLIGTELAELDDLSEVATCTVGGKRLFYGRGPVSWSSPTATRRTRNPYSDYGYYFLTESDGEPLSVDSAAFVSSFYPSADDYHTLYEVDQYSWYHGGRNLFEDDPISVGTAKDYALPNPTQSTRGTLSIGISAGTASIATIDFNGEEIDDLYISLGNYDKGNETEEVYYVDNLQAVDSIRVTPISGGPVRLDYISLAYDTPRPAPLLSTGAFAVPEYVYNITNQDHHADGAVDMVIIVPTSRKIIKPAQQLADFHVEHDGMRVRVVSADELYNEFSSGTPDANAYRRYLKMLYDRAATEQDMPKYLLLFGDCVWDNRMLTSDCSSMNPDDYLLAFESENSFSEVFCYVDDGWFTLLDDGEGINPQGSDKMDLAVGRFPVTAEAEAQIMVDKTIAYISNQNAGDWQNVIMFMGDDGNNNLHMRDINETAETIIALHPGYLSKKVMWDAYNREVLATGNRYPAVSDLIKQQQQAGALIMDYAGHGSEIQISHEAVLSLTDFQSFNNTNLPLWITASCDIMPFDGTQGTIGESAVLNKKGGAVAFYGTTRTVYAVENKRLNTAYLKHVLTVDNFVPVSVGEAARLARNEMITSGQDLSTNKIQYSLLGDPALALHLPTLDVVIDDINGQAPGGVDMPVLKAGSIVTVKGHVARNGEKETTFQGKMSATVRDTRELITCKLNGGDADKAFTFYDRQKILFNGVDSVRNGEFSFTFAVPRDINYADGTGLINVHAVNNAHTLAAHGAEEGFYINGTEEISNDSIGPSLYCYLNTPSFVNGGNVNATPYFVATITDKDGINATGNGIGHDLELVIDGDMAKTYNLNNNFTYDFGSYTSGSTYYNIPTLEPGFHTLKFRAWDILNNSSTATLNFNVVKGLEPEIMSVSCTNNPASTETTFIVSHNYSGSNVDVEVSIFDMSGRELWRHTESGVSTGTSYTIDWDLTVDGGRRLQTGVYLYRVRLSSDGSSQASKAKKLIVIGN